MKEKNIKGITLIAVVITVIILLILAGIGITMIANQNGILEKTTKAIKETGIARSRRRSKCNIYG